MLTMLQMNTLFEDSKNKVTPTRLVAEILDSRKAELARVMRHRDRVIRHSPKRGYQALSDRAARVMAAANDFISKELQ